MLAGTGASLLSAGLSRAARADEATKMPPQPTVEMWAKSPALDSVTMSPDGDHIAYMKEDGGKKLLYHFTISTGKFQTINLGAAKVMGFSWVDNSHLAVVTLATSKIETQDMSFAGGRQTYRIVSLYNMQTLSAVTLFNQMDTFATFVVGGVHTIRKGGVTEVAAASYPLNGDEFKYLYRFNLDGKLPVLMDRAPWGTLNWVLTPEGDMVARAVYSQSAKTWALDYYNGGSWKTIYSKQNDLDFPDLIGLGRDGKSLVIYVETPGIAGSYYEISPQGVLSEPLPIDGKGAGPLFDPITRRLCGYSSYDGWPKYTYFDPAMQDIVGKAAAAVDGYRMRLEDMADDPHKVILYTEGDDDNGTYYFIDFISGKTINIGSSYPQIPAEWIAPKKAIKYKAGDGMEIEAYLTLPPGRDAKNLPLIVLPHGGPVARDGMEFDREPQTYASRGYAVLQPNYRGSDGYGQAFVEAGYGQWGRKMQTDLSDGVRELVKQGLVAPKRVCIVGASYGGYAALAGATLDVGIYNCAVDVAGVSNFRTFMQNLSNYAEVNTDSPLYKGETRLLGDPSTWDEVSPVKHVDKVTIPVLIVHGKDDTVVPFEQSTEMVNALKSAGKDVTFIQYDHEDHWETNETARTDMLKTIVAFIEKHNPPA